MKNILRSLLFLMGLFFLGCQTEDSSQTVDKGVSLTKESPLALLLSRVSQNATFCDNAIDQSSCYSISLPFTITVDGQQVAVDSESDYDTVENIMNASGSDDDIVHFEFPITIIFPDFHQQVIESQEQLDLVACNDDDFHEIRCADFMYPITVNTYNTATQLAGVQTVGNDAQLYNLIVNAAAEEIFTIVYPVTLTLSSGGSATANTNDELENIIEDSIDDCDNDPGSGPAPETLPEIITTGSWHVSYCDEPSALSNYDGYAFTFLPNGSVSAVKNSITTSGTWSLYSDGSHDMMALSFASQQLQGLDGDEWRVTEYNETNIRLKDESDDSGRSGDDSGHDRVYFTRN
jgi:hypothetical protein